MNFGAVWKVGVFLSIHMLSVSHTWIVELGSGRVFFTIVVREVLLDRQQAGEEDYTEEARTGALEFW